MRLRLFMQSVGWPLLAIPIGWPHPAAPKAREITAQAHAEYLGRIYAFAERPSHAGSIGGGTMFYAVGFENVTFAAMLCECSRRRCPYIFNANIPPSLCPSQRATVGISIPLSTQRVAKRCRKEWCVSRAQPTSRHALVRAPWHSDTRQIRSASFG